MTYDATRALELLRAGTGDAHAQFRDGQEEAISHVVEGRGRLLVVQRTGWGKSFVYFIATKLLREEGRGPALLISPLLSLMRNQIGAAERMGVRAVTIHSQNQGEWNEIEELIEKNKADIVIISPERLANDRFRDEVLPQIAGQVSLLVIDEAHCVSDWGHDFRPHYRLLERTVRHLPKTVRLLATTATANDRVMADLRLVLGPNLDVSRGELNRPSLYLQSIALPSPPERLAWLSDNIPLLPGSGIIYTLTKRDAQQVAEWLRHRNINAYAYTADSDNRESLEQGLLNNSLKALVATTSLGMGFDKPDLGFVVHYQMPGSVVAYYQQVGRAGRAIASAYGILLCGEEDTDINDFFIESAFPTPEEVQVVIEALEKAPSGRSVPQLLEQVNLNSERVEKTLALLALESPAPVVKQGSQWQLIAATLNEGFWERAKRLTALRRKEQEEMQEYAKLQSGHMEFLIRALDGDPSRVQSAQLRSLPTRVNPASAKDAVEFLRRTNLPIAPRKQWPPGGMPTYKLSGLIQPARRASGGMALCYWQDAGWGGLVHKGKYEDGTFSEELVSACVNMIRTWNPNPAPTWVTCIPSRRHPNQVPNLAIRLAMALKLPFHDTLEKIVDRREQKEMSNGIQQARNVDGSLAVKTNPLPVGPVLLVDDMAKSRWTFTVAAWLLQEHGSGAVYPVALALA